MRYIITGATSPIGVALIEECIKRNISVIAVANPNSKRIDNIHYDNRIEVVFCPLEELADLHIDTKADAFIHLAWMSTAGEISRNLVCVQADNIKYTLDAVDLAKRTGCEVFIGAGSQAEYGRTDKVLTEETTCNPESGYGMAKLCAGQMSRLYCMQKGIRHIWMRILSVYGPYCSPNTVINYTIMKLLKGEIPLLSKGEQMWDFIYTSDVAEAIISLVNNGIGGETYVIGKGESRQLKEYLIEIRNIINPGLELGLGKIPYTNSTVMHLACDISKLKKDTGFEPTTDFFRGIIKTVNYYRDMKM